MIQTVLSVAALLVSVIAIVVSYGASRTTEQRSRMPVLIFIYDDRAGWLLRNVGNGPALNVVVARRDEGGEWDHPVRIPPLARDSEFVLNWIGHKAQVLGATYVDFLAGDKRQGGRYTATCMHDLNRVQQGTHLPRWREEKIGRYWAFSGGRPPPYSRLATSTADIQTPTTNERANGTGRDATEQSETD